MINWDEYGLPLRLYRYVTNNVIYGYDVKIGEGMWF